MMEFFAERRNYDQLARRAGFGPRCIIFHPFSTNRACYDPFLWNDRTFATAHHYIIEHWDNLEYGAVIDVEFILGETDEPKKSESVDVIMMLQKELDSL